MLPLSQHSPSRRRIRIARYSHTSKPCLSWLIYFNVLLSRNVPVFCGEEDFRSSGRTELSSIPKQKPRHGGKTPQSEHSTKSNPTYATAKMTLVAARLGLASRGLITLRYFATGNPGIAARVPSPHAGRWLILEPHPLSSSVPLPSPRGNSNHKASSLAVSVGVFRSR